jgi:hypothetical protein
MIVLDRLLGTEETQIRVLETRSRLLNTCRQGYANRYDTRQYTEAVTETTCNTDAIRGTIVDAGKI